MLPLHPLKNYMSYLFVNSYFCNLPLVVSLLISSKKKFLVLKNPRLLNFVIWTWKSVCPWFPKALLNRIFYHHSQLWRYLYLGIYFRFDGTSKWWNIVINGYSLLRADHCSNSYCGGVCFYLKGHLPLIRRNDLSILQGNLAMKIIVGNEKCFLTCLYKFPNQNH